MANNSEEGQGSQSDDDDDDEGVHEKFTKTLCKP
jgi:hypothetical protein